MNPGRQGQLTDTQNYIFGLSSTRDVNAYTEELLPASSPDMNDKLFEVFRSVADRYLHLKEESLYRRAHKTAPTPSHLNFCICMLAKPTFA